MPTLGEPQVLPHQGIQQEHEPNSVYQARLEWEKTNSQEMPGIGTPVPGSLSEARCSHLFLDVLAPWGRRQTESHPLHSTMMSTPNLCGVHSPYLVQRLGIVIQSIRYPGNHLTEHLLLEPDAQYLLQLVLGWTIGRNHTRYWLLRSHSEALPTLSPAGR